MDTVPAGQVGRINTQDRLWVIFSNSYSQQVNLPTGHFSRNFLSQVLFSKHFKFFFFYRFFFSTIPCPFSSTIFTSKYRVQYLFPSPLLHFPVTVWAMIIWGIFNIILILILYKPNEGLKNNKLVGRLETITRPYSG